MHKKWDYADLIVYFQVRNTKKKLSARGLREKVKNLVTKTMHEKLSNNIQKIVVAKENKRMKENCSTSCMMPNTSFTANGIIPGDFCSPYDTIKWHQNCCNNDFQFPAY